ncbi:MAG TPA: hypothetical protein VF883_16860 [Thermoanaerobaculia bacterium]
MKSVIGIIAILMLRCAAPAPVPEPATNTPAAPAARPDAAPPLSQRCTNAQYRLSIAYPAGWYTNDGSVVPECSVFAPKPVQVPRDSEMPFEIPIVLAVQTVKVEEVTRSSQWERVLSSGPVTVAGRRGVRAEVEASGEGLAEKGMRSVRYAVALGDGRTLLASTHDRAGSYELNQKILGRMMESITFE